jgi:hypothetical protein
VPAGGTAGQFLTKIDETNYNTDWTTLDVSDKRDLTDYDFTNVANTRLDSFGVNLIPLSGDVGTFASFITAGSVTFSVDDSNGGTIDGTQSNSQLGSSAALVRTRSWESGSPDAGSQIYLSTTGVSFRNYEGSTSGFTQYGNTSITFPNASVQTIAFPGFNNAALTGNPTAPTATFGDNDTSIATTAFVQAGLLGGTANARNLEVQVRNQSGVTIPAGSIVYISGATGNLPLITLAQANNDANSAQTIGFVKTAIANNGTGYVIVRGVLEAIDTSALTEGVQLYLSPTTAGTWTTTKPSAPQHMVYVGVVIRSHPTQGTILVAVMNGLELEELHNVSAATPSDNDLLVYELSTDLWKNKSFATLGLAGLNSPTFTGTPSLPTGTIGVTQTAGNNTTALATTAFVTASNPDASTTVKGHVELATNAEVIAGTSTTLAVTPNGLEAEIVSPTVLRYFAPAWTGGTSGTGAAAITVFGQQRVVAPSSAVGFAVRSHVIAQNSRGVNPDNGAVNFSKRIAWGFRVSRYAFGTTDVNSVCRVVLGKTGGAGAPTVKSIGVYFDGTSVLKLMVHDGTTLRYVDTTFTPLQLQGFDAVIISDGTGNVSLFVNGSLAATSANGPVGTGAGSPVHNIEAENIAVLTGAPMGAYYANHTISIEA